MAFAAELSASSCPINFGASLESAISAHGTEQTNQLTVRSASS